MRKYWIISLERAQNQKHWYTHDLIDLIQQLHKVLNQLGKQTKFSVKIV